MLVGYSLVLLGELGEKSSKSECSSKAWLITHSHQLAVLPVYLALNITLGPYWNVLDLYFAVSLCITIISSVLIIYRISDVSRGNNATSRYRHTIKILVESGLLYTTVILICGILLIIQVFGIHNSWLIRVTQDFEAILVPLTVSVLVLKASNDLTEEMGIGDSTNAHNGKKCKSLYQNIGPRALPGDFHNEFQARRIKARRNVFRWHRSTYYY